MSHDGKMRRGKISKDPTNIDRIYFLEQSKPVVLVNAVVTKKKVKKNGSD